MLRPQDYINAIRTYHPSRSTKRLLILPLILLTVAGTTWAVTHVDHLTSFQTFRIFFFSNMLLWAGMLTKLGMDSVKARREKANPIQVTKRVR